MTTIFRKDRKSNGVGVLIAVINSIPLLLINSPDDIEMLIIDIIFEKDGKTRIILIYNLDSKNVLYIKILFDAIINAI